MNQELDELIFNELTNENYKLVKCEDGFYDSFKKIIIPRKGIFGQKIVISSCYNGHGVYYVKIYNNMFSFVELKYPNGKSMELAKRIFASYEEKEANLVLKKKNDYVTNWIKRYKKSNS